MAVSFSFGLGAQVKLEATVSPEQAAARRWDVAIVGSGPAGAFAARELARRGTAVLLIDRASFPRSKVCGACINGRALSILRRSGLDPSITCRGAVPLRRFRVYSGRRDADVPLAAGLAISRDLLDTALVEAAIDAGAAFLPQTQASLGAETALARTVGLRTGSSSRDITASVVLAADGLGGSLVARLPGCKPQVQEHSWIGAGTTTPDGPAPYSPGTIFMGCGRRGYVGLVRVEAGRLNIAAAMDPVGVRKQAVLG